LNTAKQPGRYGFRYDPTRFADSDQTLQGAMVRTFVLKRPTKGDGKILQKRIHDILSGQRDDGSFGDTSKDTGSELLELFKLGCSADRPEVKRAAEAVLSQKRAGRNANEWYETEGALNIYPLHALLLAGMSNAQEVHFTLRWLADHPDVWIGHDQGCPWTPAVFLKAVWEGREIEDVAATITTGFSGIADNLNDAGCLGFNDPWGYLDCAGYVDHPIARKIVEKQIPMILRAQRPDGGWGDRSFIVFRALVKYDLLEQLRKPPPLSPDWKIVRSIPAPEGDLFTMTWDGQRLWVRDKKANEAIAVSPHDGNVLQKVKLPVEKVFGIGWWDNALAVTQTEPKRLLQIDPNAGEIREEVSLDKRVEEVCGVTEVGGKMWVGDGFLCNVCILDLANLEDSRSMVLGGPGPISLTAEDNAVWHFDFWAPAIIKSDLNGQLLEWGEKPFDGSVSGLAWDGERLWALDNAQKRICVIEKSHPKNHN